MGSCQNSLRKFTLPSKIKASGLVVSVIPPVAVGTVLINGCISDVCGQNLLPGKKMKESLTSVIVRMQ